VIIGLAIITPARAQDAAGMNSTAIARSLGTGTDLLVARAPRNYVSRYDVFVAPSCLGTAELKMVQSGFDAYFGINVKRWVTLGTDYSIFQGHSDLLPQLLTPPLQRALASAILPGTHLFLPFDSNAFTFAAGPQFNIRRLRRVTFLIRPAGGAVHETIVLKPKDPISTALIGQLIPTHKKSDLTIFYGIGGGLELNLSRHTAIRLTADFVHMDLYSDVLAKGENSVRISIGPVFHFGKNVQ
jgi:hypothetical protein